MRSRGTTKNRTGLPDDVPEAFLRSVSGFVFAPAATVSQAKFDRPMLVSASHPAGVGAAAWDAVRQKATAVRDAIDAHDAHGESPALT